MMKDEEIMERDIPYFEIALGIIVIMILYSAFSGYFTIKQRCKNECENFYLSEYVSSDYVAFNIYEKCVCRHDGKEIRVWPSTPEAIELQMKLRNRD